MRTFSAEILLEFLFDGRLRNNVNPGWDAKAPSSDRLNRNEAMAFQITTSPFGLSKRPNSRPGGDPAGRGLRLHEPHAGDERRDQADLAGLMLCGQARTVTTMVGDCGPICSLIGRARPARSSSSTPAASRIHSRLGRRHDGGGRPPDSAARWSMAPFGTLRICASRVSPMFCRARRAARVPSGFGGPIDGPASVAGVPIRPGDIVLGDDDGVVVVPLERAPKCWKPRRRTLSSRRSG